jgi:hypothetical protein
MYEGLPSDFYLRLVGDAARMIRGEMPLTEQIPPQLTAQTSIKNLAAPGNTP